MTSCAVYQCHKFVDREGLAGFCKEHRLNAVLFHIEGLETQLAEQKKLIERLEYNQRTVLRQLRQRG
jgi:hypothetical protein